MEVLRTPWLLSHLSVCLSVGSVSSVTSVSLVVMLELPSDDRCPSVLPTDVPSAASECTV